MHFLLKLDNFCPEYNVEDPDPRQLKQPRHSMRERNSGYEVGPVRGYS